MFGVLSVLHRSGQINVLTSHKCEQLTSNLPCLRTHPIHLTNSFYRTFSLLLDISLLNLPYNFQSQK
uniref:Uncharacterized protein n=1 Tax=Anguilla anguilla TaxID=7936 RepID=A0A0E9XH86_ANGAN